ncbi:MAG: glycosyltransferase [bacterium]
MNYNIKILQFGKYYPPTIGGMEKIICLITEGLNKKNNIQCDVLCSNDKKSYEESEYDNYIVYRTKTYGKLFSTSLSPQFIRKYKELKDKYDIIHLHHPDPLAILTLFFVRPKNEKIIIHYHSDILKQKLALWFLNPFLKWGFKKSDQIIATSPKYIEGSSLLKKYRKKVQYIPLGIPADGLYVDKTIAESIKKQYSNKKIIFSLGRLIYYKGFKYLIDAANYLDDSFIIFIGGAGKLEQELQQQIDVNKLNNKVKLLGKLSDHELASFYKYCDVYCMPSIVKTEAFGVVLLEAMSFGKPIVATNIPGSGVSWVNAHNETGINVEPKNSKGLADAIKYICDNEEIYDKFSRNALKRFKGKFTDDKMVNSFIEVYKDQLYCEK